MKERRIKLLILISIIVINNILLVSAISEIPSEGSSRSFRSFIETPKTSTSTNAIYTPTSKAPVLVDITARSESEQFYIGSPIEIQVKITGDYKKILIRELIDDNFELINASPPIKAIEFSRLNTEFNYNITNNTISVRLNKLASTSSPFIYKYSIMPKKSGKFVASSFMQIMRESEKTGVETIEAKLNSINLEILQPDPKFEVSIKFPENLDASVGSILQLSYIVTYKGGYTNPANFSLVLINDTDGISIKRDYIFDETFKINKPILIPCPIECVSEGTYLLPSLWIGDMYYPIYQTITIGSFFAKHKDDFYNLISLFLQLLALGIPISFVVRRELEKIYVEVRNIREAIETTQKEKQCCINKK